MKFEERTTVAKRMTFAERIKACFKILFKGKPIETLTYGVRVVRCDECAYNLKCDECAYKAIAERVRVDNG